MAEPLTPSEEHYQQYSSDAENPQRATAVFAVRG